jgi:hypothetical protein
MRTIVSNRFIAIIKIEPEYLAAQHLTQIMSVKILSYNVKNSPVQEF